MRLSDWIKDAGTSGKGRNGASVPPPTATGSTPGVASPVEAPPASTPEAAAPKNWVSDVTPDKGERMSAIYKAALELGIELPPEVAITPEQVKAKLTFLFNKIRDPSADQYGLWEMAKHIAGDAQQLTSAAVINFEIRPGTMEDDPLQYLVAHSINTALLAMDLAADERGLPFPVHDLGAAGLLHDMGFMLMKDGLARVRDEANPALAEHIMKGVELARKIGAPAPVVEMIAQHHERLDGKGFPGAIAGKQFPRWSQLLGVANLLAVSLFLESPRSKADAGREKARDLLDILAEYRKAFDYDLLKRVISFSGFYPVGTIVELNNHAICEVVQQNAGLPLRPVLKVVVEGSGNHPDIAKLIDLKEEVVLSVVRKVS